MDIEKIGLRDLQPSQFYVSQKKLDAVRRWFDREDLFNYSPLPVKILEGGIVLTDGHTRALAAHLAGLSKVPLVWEQDDLDWEAYRCCVLACKERGVFSPADLRDRVLPDGEYQEKWFGWCRDLHEELVQKRGRDGESLEK